jgi:hypothetical protein
MPCHPEKMASTKRIGLKAHSQHLSKNRFMLKYSAFLNPRNQQPEPTHQLVPFHVTGQTRASHKGMRSAAHEKVGRVSLPTWIVANGSDRYEFRNRFPGQCDSVLCLISNDRALR